jgi:hypothetical protein
MSETEEAAVRVLRFLKVAALAAVRSTLEAVV